MYDFSLVKVFGSPNQLLQIALDLKLGQSLASFEDLVQRLVVAQFEDNIDVICILKGPLKLND